MYKYDNLTFSFREHKENHITVCEVTISAYPHHVYTGIARLKPGDTPNQHEAQKVSLGRALKNAGFSQEYRKKVVTWWEGEYQKRHKDKKLTNPSSTTSTPPNNSIVLNDENDIMKIGDIVYRDGEFFFTVQIYHNDFVKSLHIGDTEPHVYTVYRPLYK